MGREKYFYKKLKKNDKGEKLTSKTGSKNDIVGRGEKCGMV